MRILSAILILTAMAAARAEDPARLWRLGAAEEVRTRAVEGWRIYQDVLLNHKDWLTAK